jgi:hypothetical protein
MAEYLVKSNAKNIEPLHVVFTEAETLSIFCDGKFYTEEEWRSRLSNCSGSPFISLEK